MIGRGDLKAICQGPCPCYDCTGEASVIVHVTHECAHDIVLALATERDNRNRRCKIPGFKFGVCEVNLVERFPS
jgi:hypothetical protein